MDADLLKNKIDELLPQQTDRAREQLLTFSTYLLEENEKLNLTAVTSEEEFAVKHLLDSLSGEKFITQNANLIDIGTGGGFPGMVLAIARPDLQVTLNDSIGKKCDFLERAKEKLGLRNINVICERAEILGQNPVYREKFQVATSRAVARLNSLTELALPLLSIGGKFVAYKGVTGGEELAEAKNAITLLGGKSDEPYIFDLKNSYTRTLCIINKVAETPNIYPRNAKKIQAKPL